MEYLEYKKGTPNGVPIHEQPKPSILSTRNALTGQERWPTY